MNKKKKDDHPKVLFLRTKDAEPALSSGGTVETIVNTPMEPETEPDVSPDTVIVQSFTYNGIGDFTEHPFIVPVDTLCDILIVGGGGGGGGSGVDARGAGGGGAGQFRFLQSILVSGSATIQVGAGGAGGIATSQSIATNGSNGNGSSITINTIQYNSFGGGGGARGVGGGKIQGNGGASGGGGVGDNNVIYDNPEEFGGAPITPFVNDATLYTGFEGGKGGGNFHGGGGGGFKGAGGNAIMGFAGNGGIGISNDITGELVGYAGGGGGGVYLGFNDNQKAGTASHRGGKGGGFNLVSSTLVSSGAPGENAINGSGSGGGGASAGQNTNNNGGSGGSGIVIIRYVVASPIPEGTPTITHKTLNFAFNQDNLVAYYNFNINGSLGLDSNPSNTKYNLTPTIVGGTGGFDTSIAIEGGSFQSTNDGDRLEGDFPAKTIYDNSTTGISFSLWFFRTSATFDNDFSMALFTLFNPSNPSQVFTLTASHFNGIKRLNFSFQYTNGETYSSAFGPIQTFNTWFHIVFIVNKSGIIKVYIDGVNLNLVTGTTGGTIRFYGSSTYPLPQFPNTTRLRIHNAFNLGAFSGNIDEFYVFNKELTQTEITTLYNKTYYLPNNTYTLTATAGTQAQINGGAFQELSGNYQVNVGDTQSSVLALDGQTNPFPATDGSTIAIRYSTTLTVITEGQAELPRNIFDFIIPSSFVLHIKKKSYLRVNSISYHFDEEVVSNPHTINHFDMIKISGIKYNPSTYISSDRNNPIIYAINNGEVNKIQQQTFRLELVPQIIHNLTLEIGDGTNVGLLATEHITVGLIIEEDTD